MGESERSSVYTDERLFPVVEYCEGRESCVNVGQGFSTSAPVTFGAG